MSALTKIPLVAATQNVGKLREMRRILAAFPEIELRGLPSRFPMPKETGGTYYDNALIKAQAAFDFFDGRYPCFGEDSGLEIAALDGLPGLYTARFLAPRPYSERIKIVLDILRYAKTRAARYAAEVVLLWPQNDGFVWPVPTFYGDWHGRIAEKPQGRGGFAYDPVFVGEGTEGLTAAQLSLRCKDVLGHRGQALRAMAQWVLAQTI